MIVNDSLGRPVQNVQTFLRRISAADGDIPVVVPDGIFGEATEDAVIAFRDKYGPPPPIGEVDFDTWNRLLTVYDDIAFVAAPPTAVAIYPMEGVIRPGEESVYLLPIQGMLAALTQSFPQLGYTTVTGVHDEASVEAVKKLQKLFGLPQSGTIDKAFWEELVPFYEANAGR